MTATSTSSNSNTEEPSEMSKLKRDKFALLARVGHQKKEVSQLHDEADFYCGSVIDLLALLVDQSALLQRLADRSPHPLLKGLVADYTSRQCRLTKQLLNFWPRNSISQARVLCLLDSDGLVKMTDDTADGYVFLSTDLILKNVERAIAATKGLSPKTLSSSETKTPSLAVGIDGNAVALT